MSLPSMATMRDACVGLRARRRFYFVILPSLCHRKRLAVSCFSRPTAYSKRQPSAHLHVVKGRIALAYSRSYKNGGDNKMIRVWASLMLVFAALNVAWAAEVSASL